MVVDHVNVTVENGPISQEEISNYIEHIQTNNPRRILKKLSLRIDGEEVEMRYEFAPENFQRIRRITGYLVGTVERWNNAKQEEERDRVKHN